MQLLYFTVFLLLLAKPQGMCIWGVCGCVGVNLCYLLIAHLCIVNNTFDVMASRLSYHFFIFHKNLYEMQTPPNNLRTTRT